MKTVLTSTVKPIPLTFVLSIHTDTYTCTFEPSKRKRVTKLDELRVVLKACGVVGCVLIGKHKTGDSKQMKTLRNWKL